MLTQARNFGEPMKCTTLKEEIIARSKPEYEDLNGFNGIRGYVSVHRLVASLQIKDVIQPHANPPVNYPASENDVTHSRKRALNIYKSLITGVNESFEQDSGGAQWEGSDLANRGKRGKAGNNYRAGG